MKRTHLLFCALAAAIAVAATATSAASACAYGGTCHGTILWETPANTYTGGLAALNASALSVPNGTTDFANHEMWVGTNNAPSTQFLGPFVEMGMKYGTEDQHENYGLILFWDEYDTQQTVAFHRIQSASLNTTYNVKISYSGTNSWGIYLNGSNLGGTGNHEPCCVGFLQVGGEETTTGASINATGKSLQKRASDGITWSYGWSGTTHTDGPGSTIVPSWTSSPTEMQEHT